MRVYDCPRALGVVDEGSTSVIRRGRRVLVTSNELYSELISGERAVRADETEGGGCARDCARCCGRSPSRLAARASP